MGEIKERVSGVERSGSEWVSGMGVSRERNKQRDQLTVRQTDRQIDRQGQAVRGDRVKFSLPSPLPLYVKSTVCSFPEGREGRAMGGDL